MNARQLAQVGLGVLGVWTLVTAVGIVAGFFESIAVAEGSVSGVAFLVVGMPAVILFGLSYVLVFHNAQLAAAITPTDAAIDHATPGLARLLVALTGVIVVLESSPRFVNLVLNIFAVADDPEAVHGGALARGLISTSIELACALYLVLRPERFLAFLNRHRTAPVEVTA